MDFKTKLGLLADPSVTRYGHSLQKSAGTVHDQPQFQEAGFGRLPLLGMRIGSAIGRSKPVQAFANNKVVPWLVNNPAVRTAPMRMRRAFNKGLDGIKNWFKPRGEATAQAPNTIKQKLGDRLVNTPLTRPGQKFSIQTRNGQRILTGANPTSTPLNYSGGALRTAAPRFQNETVIRNLSGNPVKDFATGILDKSRYLRKLPEDMRYVTNYAKPVGPFSGSLGKGLLSPSKNLSLTRSYTGNSGLANSIMQPVRGATGLSKNLLMTTATPTLAYQAGMGQLAQQALEEAQRENQELKSVINQFLGNGR